MFYGSGAGKLPTASAVVADMVDIAKHINRNIWVEWSSKKLELSEFLQIQNMFFVRTSADKEEVKKVFGEVEFVEAPQITGEIGFITGVLTEEAFAEKKEKLYGILSVIRVS